MFNPINWLDPSGRLVRKYSRVAQRINELEPAMKARDDDSLRQYVMAIRDQVQNGRSIDEALPEVFAAVREASVRTLGQRHFDVQLIGGMVLHSGRIAEMKTGEGKTLVATLPLTLNALLGKGAHLVTTNDYLAKRDAEWMGPIYRFFGLTVGIIQHDMDAPDRLAAYASDITYGTNNELGFDYLRDNMAFSRDRLVQRGLYYAIVDEVDSILIDEARTPLIISGVKQASSDLYRRFDRIVASLTRDKHYEVEEKQHQVSLTDEGVEAVERALGIDNLSDPECVEYVHHVNCALKAHTLYKRDVDYVVRDGQVIIVDEFTGRLMFGRRYGEGLHQAIEAKENVKVEQESQTLATITFQNFFRLYERLAGMTGTAKTEEPEFIRIYDMPVVIVPTNRPVRRVDHPDIVYKTEEAKFRGIATEILQCHLRGQPVLVGTRSIEISERLSDRLSPDRLQRLAMATLLVERLQTGGRGGDPKERRALEEQLFQPLDNLNPGAIRRAARMVDMPSDPLSDDVVAAFAQAIGVPSEAERLAEVLRSGIPHNVLNAKYHEREAQIIAQAGRIGAVTIATNMAGRGVDIQLGGKPPEGMDVSPDYETVRALGGLHILGTERHESRRIDNQLRGRSGRQGDPGSSRFFVCLEDELWRLFGAQERFQSLQRSWRDNEPIENRLLSRMIENAQRRVESHHFDIRKQVLKFDDVMNTQRSVIYGERRKILEAEDFRDTIMDMIDYVVDRAMERYASPRLSSEEWEMGELLDTLRGVAPIDYLMDTEALAADPPPGDELREQLIGAIRRGYEAREAQFGAEQMRALERWCMLQVIDDQWIDHLAAMDYLRDGIFLRAQGEQKDPVVLYHKEAFDMFEELLEAIREDTIRALFRVRLAETEEPQQSAYQPQEEGRGSSPGEALPGQRRRAPVRKGQEVGRNDPCPCGSGRKYKRCCLGKAG
ncbi:MAG TPA: preprotein translocase subunit SecA [Armatimonadota bacterium]|nr:preprotein translocase subunit SecA [Armatimonadota bacterium]